jgi:hypothetical protein
VWLQVKIWQPDRFHLRAFDFDFHHIAWAIVTDRIPQLFEIVNRLSFVAHNDVADFQTGALGSRVDRYLS